MGMKASILPVMVVAALVAPVYAVAGGALNQARAVSGDPVNFDGARAHPEGSLVRADAKTDTRTAEQIAKDEQAKADARLNLTATTSGPDNEIAAPKPSEWLKREHILSGVKIGLVGLLIGSLWGMTGLGIGILVGGLLGYTLSRIMS